MLGVEDCEKSLDDLSGLLWNSVRECGKTWQQVAQDARLCETTVERLMWRETKKPHYETVFKILIALGFRSAIVPDHAPLQPDECIGSADDRPRRRVRTRPGGSKKQPSDY